MSSVALILNIFFACFITSIFLYRCGNYRRQHPITTGAVFIAWSFSVLIVFLLPLDISLVNIIFIQYSSFKIRIPLNFVRLRTKNVDPMEQLVKIPNKNPLNRVQNLGHMSIRNRMKFCGELSIGHPNFSLGNSNWVFFSSITSLSRNVSLFRIVLPFMQSICQTGLKDLPFASLNRLNN